MRTRRLHSRRFPFSGLGVWPPDDLSRFRNLSLTLSSHRGLLCAQGGHSGALVNTSEADISQPFGEGGNGSRPWENVACECCRAVSLRQWRPERTQKAGKRLRPQLYCLLPLRFDAFTRPCMGTLLSRHILAPCLPGCRGDGNDPRGARFLARRAPQPCIRWVLAGPEP